MTIDQPNATTPKSPPSLAILVDRLHLPMDSNDAIFRLVRTNAGELTHPVAQGLDP